MLRALIAILQNRPQPVVLGLCLHHQAVVVTGRVVHRHFSTHVDRVCGGSIVSRVDSPCLEPEQHLAFR